MKVSRDLGVQRFITRLQPLAKTSNMNLFCFTLDGSSESIYEPAYSNQPLKEVLPKSQFSPLLRRKWAGSDPNINCERLQSSVKVKRNNRRSCVATSLLDNETLDVDVNHACWSSLVTDRRDSSLERTVQDREMCKPPCQSSMWTRDNRLKEKSGRTPTGLQAAEHADESAQSVRSTMKKLQNLVQAKKGQSDNNNMLGHNNPVLSCIGLGKRTEKKSSKTAKSPQEPQQQVTKVHEDADEGLVRPLDCSQPRTPFDHICHQPGRELWLHSGNYSLPRTTEWDRFESLIQELDSKQSDFSPPQMIRSITDLHLTQNPLTRFERFGTHRQHSPMMKPQDNGTSLPWLNCSPTQLRPRDVEGLSPTDRRHTGTPSEETITATTNEEAQTDEAVTKETGDARPLSKGRELSSNSLESLYSFNSGQSSSSGVTSGSDCSSNRGSLRLEDDLLFTRQFCGRARVHTDFMPSPYDTESLKLKVGDVIDIISKPPMGIWTGMLNDKIGNFKFIYVDVLKEEGPETHKETHRMRHKCRSTVHEVLKRLSLQEYSSSLQLNGYQTVDDLMRLQEHHLMELNVTDPDHRHRLLAAIETLQQLCSNCHSENVSNQEGENMRADINGCPRDSGCHMPSDSPIDGGEDADLQFDCEHALLTDTT